MNNAPYRQKYREIANQRQQVAMFWKGEAEVLVIDESVMKWFTKELANDVDTSAPLVYSHIFPAQTQFRISFKNQQVRDDFDAGFQEIRASGLVEEIYDRYLK
jgi:polar amino acid transport system substrate-binding protein